MPVQRPYDRCVDCNRPHIGAATYVQATYGFKNNGCNLVKHSKLREHMENVKVRG